MRTYYVQHPGQGTWDENRYSIDEILVGVVQVLGMAAQGGDASME